MARQFKTEYELESESSGRDAVPSVRKFDADGGSLNFDLRNRDFDAMNTSSFRSGYIVKSVSVRNILVDHVPCFVGERDVNLMHARISELY